MRVHHPRVDSQTQLRRRLERLDALPLRPATARQVLGSLPDPALEDESADRETPKLPAAVETDPGWVLAQARETAAFDPLRLLTASPWWTSQSGPGADALNRLWRHAVAVQQAARRLAREAGDPDSERVAAAGLLHSLGLWSAAAVDPEWVAAWLAEESHDRRRELETRTFGAELTSLGRTLAERWGCDPLVRDAAWLHADRDGGLNRVASDPTRLAWIQDAYAWAEQTPWALFAGRSKELSAAEPRLRVLIAEVQVRCASALVEHDATPHEERLTRANARLRLQVSQLRDGVAARDRFLQAFSESSPSDVPEVWAERAGHAWCGEAGVATARVLWKGLDAPAPNATERSPERVIPLGERGQPCAEIHLWTDGTGRADGREHAPLGAWQAWASAVADRAGLGQRLEGVVRAYREHVERAEPAFRQAKLDALAEFAAGAGHELNNPLAVIVGRAQLLLVNENDAGRLRSLRAIIAQAQRAHRILRDLMFVARVPEPRPRICQPDEIVRNCLRDLKAEAEARGIRLAFDCGDSAVRAWADHDALRQLFETLLRNALEATSKGGKIQVTTSGDTANLRWTIHDTGRGISATEGQHLFDPFYCGRQAGRGLGLGLPRAARLVSQAGGELRWHSTPGQGSTFHVHLPLGTPPKPPVASAPNEREHDAGPARATNGT
ncbi:MAG: ATP-binding protein [Isosphaeraceae bacterium]|nr:ATP-binding protein [Isosphaeraceae bacterium]